MRFPFLKKWRRSWKFWQDSAGERCSFTRPARHLTRRPWLESLEKRLTPAAPPLQFFYVPYPAQSILASMNALGAAGNTEEEVVSISISTNNTIIYYDHWEDGYEPNLASPVQASTQIWGDGNPANGVAPGHPSDLLNAGDIITLQNAIPANPRNPAAVFFDGGDKIGASQTISVATANWPTQNGTLEADASEVYDTRFFGTSFVSPIGENINPTTSATNLPFGLTQLYVMASQNNTTVNLDYNGDGIVDNTVVLNQGGSFVSPSATVVNAGATVTSDKPVEVDVVTGAIGLTYETRYFALNASNNLSNDYLSPVGTMNDATGNGDYDLFTYNPNAAAITVTYQDQSGSTNVVVASHTTNVHHTPLVGGNITATRVFTPGGQNFEVVGAMDIEALAANCQARDWGLTLRATAGLSPVALVSFAPGQDPTAPLTENGGPLWVTTTRNTTVYVDWDGNPATGALIDPLGNHYDQSFPVNYLQVLRLKDTVNNDDDQSRARVYTVDGTDISVAWGQDQTASLGAPGLDAGYAIPPFPTPVIDKSVAFAPGGDVNGDGLFNAGDTLLYTIHIINHGLYPILNSVTTDTLPAQLTYIANSTLLNDGVTTAPVPDSGVTPFPLDESGLTIPNIGLASTMTITYVARINNPLPSGTTIITNTADLSIGINIVRFVLDTPISGTVAGTVFNDLNNNGIQDPGDPGIGGVTLTLTGTSNTGAAVSLSTTTAANGSYQFINVPQSNAAGYTVTETQPVGYVDGLDAKAGVVIPGSNLTDVIAGIVVGVLPLKCLSHFRW